MVETVENVLDTVMISSSSLLSTNERRRNRFVPISLMLLNYAICATIAVTLFIEMYHSSACFSIEVV